MITIEAQPGFQTKFLSNPADIVIGGGSAGGGKTYALLLDPLRYYKKKGFGAVIFRRTTPQITNKGALWDTSAQIYQLIGGVPRSQPLDWRFSKYKSSIKFAHIEHEKNKYDWQGAQIPFIGFDELTHFTETQFFYLLGRNRTTIGINPCIRAGCNPDPDSWVAEFLAWWINQATGYPIPERDGKIRYFIRLEGNMIWADSKKEIIGNYPDTFKDLVKRSKASKPEDFIKSASFVRGDIYGNVELLQRDPQYLANLMALGEEEKLRLLKGNWKVRTDGMALFQFDKIQDLFSNIIAEEENPERLITCDVARFGRDLCVGMFWLGWRVKRIDILTKSDIPETIEMLEGLRKFGGVGKSNTLADQGGLGAGVVDVGGYKSFSANDSVLPDPATKIKENFDMLKTQCIYRMAEKVNRGQVAVDPQVEIYVDGVRTDKIKIGAKLFSIKKLLTDDLRTFRRADDGTDRKKKIETKDVQKAALGGRSPDCFVAGTKILTPTGEKNIEDLKIGDRVITPFGFRKITHTIQKFSKSLFELNGEILLTGNHRFFCGSGINRVDTLSSGEYIYTDSFSNLFLWRFKKLFSTEARSFGFLKLLNIIMPTFIKTESERKKHCIDLSLRKNLGKLKKDSIFITAMEILLIILLKTWKWLKANYTKKTILLNCTKTRYTQKEIIVISQINAIKRKNGIHQSRVKFGTQKTENRLGRKGSNTKKFVKFVAKSLKHFFRADQKLAQIPATKNKDIKVRLILRKENVSFVDDVFLLGRMKKQKPAQCVVRHNLVKKIKTYSITLEKDNFYFANGYLVKNCGDAFTMREWFELRPRVRIIV